MGHVQNPQKIKNEAYSWNVSMSNCFLINMSKKKKNKNKQKWLTDKLKGEWIDKDQIIEIVLFDSLIHYVKKKTGLMTLVMTFPKGWKGDTLDRILWMPSNSDKKNLTMCIFI